MNRLEPIIFLGRHPTVFDMLDLSDVSRLGMPQPDDMMFDEELDGIESMAP